MNTVEAKKSEFLDKEIWILTFGGGLQRASVYASGVSVKEKAKFRESVRKKISELVKREYRESRVSSEDHIKNLIDIKEWINKTHKTVLKDGQIKLGVVQKIVNLFLKYQWCLGLVEMPPHCPFDRIIISKLNIRNPPAWTQLDSKKDYMKLVEKASELAGQKALAEWELDVFSRRE